MAGSVGSTAHRCCSSVCSASQWLVRPAGRPHLPSEQPWYTPNPRAAFALVFGSRAQVYKGRLRSNGKQVAVKVQRPGVREQIALDVYILRYGLSLLRSWRKLNRCCCCKHHVLASAMFLLQWDWRWLP